MKLIIMISLSVFIIGCVGNNTESPTSSLNSFNANQKNTTLNHDVNYYMENMGANFDTSTYSIASPQPCLSGAYNESTIIITNPSALINFSEQQDFSALENALGIFISGQYAGGMFSGSIAAQYATNSQNSQYTTNLVYLYQYSGVATFQNGALNYGDDALTPVAKSLVHTNQIAFRTMCGNSYIAQMNAGVLLAVSLSLSFNSHMDQETFNAHISGGIGIASVVGTVQQAANDANIHVNFTLNALQLGGKPQLLNNLFGQVESNNNYPYLNCGDVGGQNINACNLMISNIITYAQSIESQLSNSDGSLNRNNLYYNNPVIANYNSLGITVGAPDPGADILAAMQTITYGYNKAVSDYTFATHYLTTLSNQLDVPTQRDLNDIQIKLTNQLNNVYLNPIYQVFNCYKGYVSESCVAIESKVATALIPYNLSTEESEVLYYLENTSYTTTIYTYTGETSESQTDYQLSAQPCILAPVSSPYTAQYAISCNDIWFPVLSGGLSISPGYNNTLQVTGLIYDAVNIESTTTYMEPINYIDTTLYQDLFYNNYYTGNGIKITGGSTFNLESGSLGLTQWPMNQA